VILLDTNVISAMTHSHADPVLQQWLDRQVEEDVWTTSVTVFEIEFGLAVMPAGRKQVALRGAWDIVRAIELKDRVVGFDGAAARAAASLAGSRKRAGTTIEIRDTQIAGIALAHGATLATRNVRHFRDLDTPVIDPWSAA
jgi:predicted nucleic acid-binding protein